jgi:DNA phosphorothioation-dependent restriction protein DptG
MIFYIAVDASNSDRKVLCSTQAEAKAIDKHFEQIDIPTDKQGLKETYQEALDTIWTMSHDKAQLREKLEAEPDTSDIPEAPEEFFQKAEVKLPAKKDSKIEAIWTATDIEDFIFNRASVNQVANILGAIGVRFGELIKTVEDEQS